MVTAAYVALSLRYDEAIGIDRLARWLPIFVILIAARVMVFVTFGLYSRRWRFASVPDLERIAVAVAAGSIIAAAVVYATSVWPGSMWTEDFPRSFWLVELLITGALVGGLRFGIRAASDWAPQPALSVVNDRRATLFYGAGRSGVLMARSARPKAGCRRAPGRIPGR